MAPHLHSHPPAVHPVDDELAHILMKQLERPTHGPTPPGVISSGLMAFFSLGVLPVLLWHDRFRDYVEEEKQQLRRFAEWMRVHSKHPETIELRAAADDLGSRPLLSTLSVMSVVGLVILFATQISGGVGPLVQQILSHTYRFRATEPWALPLSSAQQLFIAWSLGLSVAYLFHWVQVQAHASDVRRFVLDANRILQNVGSRRVPMSRVGVGFSLFWMLAATLLASKGAWWGFAFALSGAAQLRYMGAASPRFRKALAARMRELATLPGHDNGGVASTTVRRCRHAHCLAPMPGGARFCPRCGHNVAAQAAETA